MSVTYELLLCMGWSGINTTGNTFILLYHTILLDLSKMMYIYRMVFVLSKVSTCFPHVCAAPSKTTSKRLHYVEEVGFRISRVPNA